MSKQVLALYNTEEELLHAVLSVQEKKIRITEVYSPYPLHEIDSILKRKPSRLPKVAFLGGLGGAVAAFSFQSWTLAIDWRHIIGGKPALAWPSFVPITFEIMVLSAALSMVAVFFWVNRLKPQVSPSYLPPRITDDQFLIRVDSSSNFHTLEEIQSVLKETATVEILLRNEKEK